MCVLLGEREGAGGKQLERAAQDLPENYREYEGSYYWEIRLSRGEACLYNALLSQEDRACALEDLARAQTFGGSTGWWHLIAGVLAVDWADSVHYLKQAFEDEEHAGRAAFELGRCYVTGAEWHEAVRWFRRAIDAIPEFGPAWESLGAVYMQLGQEKEAVLAQRNALEANPFYCPARYWLVQNALDAGEVTVASRLIGEGGPVPDSHWNWDYWCARVAFEEGDYSRASRHLETSARILDRLRDLGGQQDSEAHLAVLTLLVRVRLKQGRGSEAMDMIEVLKAERLGGEPT